MLTVTGSVRCWRANPPMRGEHLVGLVEHHDLDALQVEAAARHVVDGAARRGDHDVGP